ncbi:hypothetical protein HDU86_004709 [Geranomyces michiganensis]|nr:hypothetical protein HDU86_004709 [Geranomyces michiganensis]
MQTIKHVLEPSTAPTVSVALPPSNHRQVASRSRFAWRSLVPVRAAINAAQATCIKTLSLTTVGFMTMKLPDGTIHKFGDAAAPDSLRAAITVRDDAFWIRVALFSTMGFAEAYMADQIRVDHLATLLGVLTRNRDRYQEMNLLPVGLNKVLNGILHSRIPNTILNAVGNIRAHYDLGNEMFACFLDPSMMYSCPIWATTDKVNDSEDTLERAQLRKIDAMIALAGIKDGDRVLEIGTGWGAFAIRCARRFESCTITTLTLSAEQKRLADARVAAAGLSARITVLLLDYRNMDRRRYGGTFDRVIAIEMLEAVGPEFLPVFFAKCDELLHPTRGTVALQVITMPDARYEQYLKRVDFIQRHIFPGGHCPSLPALIAACYSGSKGNLMLDEMHNIGPHYAKALRLWREAFTANCARVAAEHGLEDKYDPEFRRKWEFYFAYCEAGFATRTLGNAQIRFSRCGNLELAENIPL